MFLSLKKKSFMDPHLSVDTGLVPRSQPLLLHYPHYVILESRGVLSFSFCIILTVIMESQGDLSLSFCIILTLLSWSLGVHRQRHQLKPCLL